MKNSLLRWTLSLSLLIWSGLVGAKVGGECLYAGWPSTLNMARNCLPPWKSSSSPLAQYQCANGATRCNPAYFSNARNPQGVCVGGRGVVIADYNQACIKAMPEIIARYQNNKNFQAQNQAGLGVEIAKYCRQNASQLQCAMLNRPVVEASITDPNAVCFRGQVRDKSWLDGLAKSMLQVGAAIGVVAGGGALLASQLGRNSSANAEEEQAQEAEREREITESGSPLALTSFRDERTPVQRTTSFFRGNRSPSSVASYTPGPRAEIDYELSEGEEDELVRSGRIETGEDIYGMLAQTARDAFASGGERACRSALASAYERIQPKPIWQDLSLEERSKEIFRHANHTYQKLTEQGQSGSSVNDPNQLHSDLSPAVAVCIAFIETRGTLNPHAMNYTFCQNNNTSTAHGLGQMTRRTFRNMRGAGGRPNLLPLTVANQYDNLDTDQIFSLLNNDVTLQMEVLLRYVNYEIKRSGDLMTGVQAYDQDQASNYMRKFRQCHSCVNELSNESGVYQCYQNMQ